MAGIDSQRRLAARVAARLQLRDVRLFSQKCSLDDIPDPGAQLGYGLNVDARAEWDEGDPHVVVKCDYTLVLEQRNETDADEDIDRLASIDFTYGALFQLELRDGDEPPTQEELAAYAGTTGSFALYPFAREYVRDVTSRMGLPALTLGVLLLPVGKDEAVPELPSR